MPDDYEKRYTKPALRRQIKDELMRSSKGGKPGQWSARKSQMLTQQYERQGGGYKSDPDQLKAAHSLATWTEQQWQTEDGSAYASRNGQPTKRYLPKRAWDLLSESEKRETDQKKQREGAQAAKQFVKNTVEAKAARAYAAHGDASELSVAQLQRLTKAELARLASEADLSGRSSMSKEMLASALYEYYHKKRIAKSGQNASDPATHTPATKAGLYERAKRLGIAGRSKMSKSELALAVEQAS